MWPPIVPAGYSKRAVCAAGAGDVPGPFDVSAAGHSGARVGGAIDVQVARHHRVVGKCAAVSAGKYDAVVVRRECVTGKGNATDTRRDVDSHVRAIGDRVVTESVRGTRGADHRAIATERPTVDVAAVHRVGGTRDRDEPIVVCGGCGPGKFSAVAG